MRPTLRPYQNKALDAVWAAIAAGLRRVLIKKPTGTGKTVMFAELPRRIAPWLKEFPKGQRKMLVIAHREELLDQAADKIRRAMPGVMVSIEQGDRYANRNSDVIIASIQTLAAMKFRRLKDLIRFNAFRLVIIDEAHHAAAATYRTALVHLGFLPPADATDTENIEAAVETDVVEMAKHLEDWDARAPRDRILVGVTATPNRSDAIGLGCVFQTIAYNYALKQAIDDGYLVSITPWVVETDVSLDEVRTNHGEFNQRQLADTVNNPKRNELAVEAWLQYARDRQTLAFTVDVAHAHALAATFVDKGVNAVALSGETPKDERRRMLEDFRRGLIQVICNCMVLTEGTDLPTVGCILHAKPTKSSTLYEQMTGRGLRPHPEDPVGPERLAFKGDLRKIDCIVLDVVDVARKHSLQTAPVLYGLPPNVDPKGKDLGLLERELEALMAKYPGLNIEEQGRTSLRDLEVRASTFDIWSVPELGALANVVDLGWVKTGTETYRLQYPWADGIEVIAVSPNVLGKFDISLTLRPALRVGATLPAVRQRTLGNTYEDAAHALQAAEAFLRHDRPDIMRMKSRNNPWRSRPATAKQVALLQRLNAPIRPGITFGEASDMLDVAMARKNR
jgi:superfamily II DNA or RNA helicase